MHKFFPNKYYFINRFERKKIDNLEINTAVIYRNYKTKLNYQEILQTKNYCRKKKIKFVLSNDFKLAIKMDLDGTYIPSFNKCFRHLNYNMKKKFLILGSAHNLKEIRHKEKQKINLIFLSSIFKKNKNYLGLYKFKNLKILTKRKVIALGGINKYNKKMLRLVDCHGFSGISYFE